MDRSFHYLLLAAQGLFQRTAMTELSGMDLTEEQFRVLDYLGQHDGSLQEYIAAGCQMDPAAAADALANEGDVTEVTETEKGLYVAKLTSLLDREATDAEKQNIIEERKQEQYDSLLEEWKDAIEIEVNDRVWNKVDFIDQGVTVVTPEEETDTTEDSGTDTTTEGTESTDGTDSTDTSGTDAAADSGSTTDDTAE